MTFGKRLKLARQEKHMTQNDVAGALGVDFTTISKYENNRSQPDNEILRELASIYEVSLDWLLTGVDKEPPSAEPNRFVLQGVEEALTEEEAGHLQEQLEMYRLLQEKRKKEKDAVRRKT
ncbi:helix-turn-helix domain-containing protein [Cohnella rhizosphaerae]|uniref:Helix-turn-helix domain-containing protein n=1 Tax=Cohnella rhizosphaerae TaxID=1457232 RepID=A0A9X4KQE1_9BACL|nr:helix-turn-helix transcriptional regulator [Cohnella rhizosphaerae]MDG0808321.1 helix-turn-helix domain-containing protein [Cohnella rhizosphaerae]